MGNSAGPDLSEARSIPFAQTIAEMAVAAFCETCSPHYSRTIANWANFARFNPAIAAIAVSQPREQSQPAPN
jgi:hypothetical protein